jgi:hypothetical protein
VGREAICPLFFPLLLQLAFVFPGIAVGTQAFVESPWVNMVVGLGNMLNILSGGGHFLNSAVLIKRDEGERIGYPRV